MKMNFVPGLLLLAATTALAAPPEAIQRVALDERVVVTVPVSTNRVTTISFPGPIPPEISESGVLDTVFAFLLRAIEQDKVVRQLHQTSRDESYAVVQ